MATFTPPTVYDNPPILPDSRGAVKRLWRYFNNRARYVNVFKLSDGTYVQDTGTAENSNTNVPYPWDPSRPSEPFATSYYIDFTQTPPKPTSTTVSQNPYIVLVYEVPTVVSAAEATALTNFTAHGTGYGALIA